MISSERVAISELGGPPEFGYREIDLKLTNKMFTSTKVLPRYRRDFLRDAGWAL